MLGLFDIATVALAGVTVALCWTARRLCAVPKAQWLGGAAVLAGAAGVADLQLNRQLLFGNPDHGSRAGALTAAFWVAVVGASAAALMAMGYATRKGGWDRRAFWAGLTSATLALSGGVALLTPVGGPSDVWATAAAGLRALAVLWASVGSGSQVRQLHTDHSAALREGEFVAQTDVVRERLRNAALRRAHHELANALTAVEGAATLLCGQFDRLSPAHRSELAVLLLKGTERLHEVLRPAGTEVVSLAGVALEVAGEAMWGGGVTVEVAPDLTAAGSQAVTAEAVRHLLEYLSRDAPAVQVTLRGERGDGWVALHVEPPPAPDGRGTPTDGREDVGYQVALRLIAGQGGEVTAQAWAAGRSAVTIRLPAVPAEGEKLDGAYV